MSIHDEVKHGSEADELRGLNAVAALPVLMSGGLRWPTAMGGGSEADELRGLNAVAALPLL